MAAAYPHVVFHVAGYHQNVGNMVDHSVLVQQTNVGRYSGWKQRIKGLLMEQMVDVATDFIGTSISGSKNSCVIQLKRLIDAIL